MNCLLKLFVLWACVSNGWCFDRTIGNIGEVRLFERTSVATYALESTVLLNEAERSDRELGYRIQGMLTVQPIARLSSTNSEQPASDDDFLLKFTLLSPKLNLRGKHLNAIYEPHKSVWDAQDGAVFYAHRTRGIITNAYLDPSEPNDIINYKKSISSLFQFQMVEGELNETDISGSCVLFYEALSKHVFRKIKKRCVWEGTTAAEEEEEVCDGDSEAVARRLTRYEVQEGGAALSTVHAEELVTLERAGAGVKARAWHSLRLRDIAPLDAPPPSLAPLQEVLASLPSSHTAHRLPFEAPATANSVWADDDFKELETLVSELAPAVRALGADTAGSGGSESEALAALRLVPAVRAAPSDILLRILNTTDVSLREGFCVLLGTSGTRASHTAAAAFLQLRATDREPAPRPARRYLAALALSDAPHHEVIAAVLALALADDTSTSDAALLAAAAAAPRVLPHTARQALEHTVRDALLRTLARCKDDECRLVRMRAIGNMRRGDLAEVALEHAERGSGRVALAALDAFEASLPPPAYMDNARRLRLTRLALDRRTRRPLEVRAAALDLLVRHALLIPTELPRIALEMHIRASHPELRRVFWQRVYALADEHPDVQFILSNIPAYLVTWDAMAAAGTSSVLQRSTGWGGRAAGGWRAGLHSLQVAAGGTLRRGLVRLHAVHPHNHTYPALEVDLWTRGLDTMMGGGDDPVGDDPEEEEAASAGLAFGVGGARMRDIILFEGQGELMGHVWAGTGSEPTPALRALHPLREVRARLPLITGVQLHARAFTAIHYALDAQVQVSLWSRTARSAMELRAGAAQQTRALLQTAWGRVSADALAATAARLAINSDLDFYDGVALCVRVATDDTIYRRNVTLASEQGDSRYKVSRRRETSVPAPGRTMSLGRLNDDACRSITAA